MRRTGSAKLDDDVVVRTRCEDSGCGCSGHWDQHRCGALSDAGVSWRHGELPSFRAWDQDGTEPSIAFPEGVVVEYRGVSSQQFTTMRSINGRQRAHTDSSYRHNYLLTVVQEGELVIPPAVLNINNQEYRSNSVRLSAMLPAESLTDVLEVRLPDRAV